MERLTREKTITVRGIEKAVCNHENDDCNDRCMYGKCRWQEKANMLLKEYEDTGISPEQVWKLKERDTAKPPIDIEDNYGFFVCPSCGNSIYASDDFESHKFCLNCGQRIRWEE